MQIGTNFWTSIQFLPTAKGSWSKERSPRTCSIFGNKFSASVLSNYGLRRRVLLLDEQLENKIDLYGVDWLDPLWLQTQRKIYAARQQLMNLREFSFRELLGELYFVPLSYKGVMDTDMTKLFVYETSLVIENQSDYVSEKIWNSLVAGTVPFYVGPEIHDEMLESCVIQVENSAEAVIEAIYQTPIKLIRNKRKNIEKLLQNYDYNKQLVKSAKNLISLVSTILKA
jgi:hypothetical protein